VDYRYPGIRATSRRMEAALRRTDHLRSQIRIRLGLPP
jgi:hypothetical protein